MRNDNLLPTLDSRLGPAHWLPEKRMTEMVDEIVLCAWGAERVRRRPGRLALAAGLAILFGAAATGFAMFALHARKSPAPTVAPSAPATPSLHRHEVRSAPVEPASPRQEATAPAVDTAPEVKQQAPSPAQVERPTPTARRDDPRTLLKRANQLRTEQRWREAAAAYERIAVDYPSSDEAYSALVAAAALYAEHLQRPSKALHLYAQALREKPSGPLTQEARWGTIAAERALGDVAAERAGLAAFLAAYPDSLFRAQAEKRLKELASTP